MKDYVCLIIIEVSCITHPLIVADAGTISSSKVRRYRWVAEKSGTEENEATLRCIECCKCRERTELPWIEINEGIQILGISDDTRELGFGRKQRPWLESMLRSQCRDCM